MPERFFVPNESIIQSLNNLDKAVLQAESASDRQKALSSVAHEYNRVFDIEIDNADNALACGTFMIEHADGSTTEQPDWLTFGSFCGFEVVPFYGKPYLVANIVSDAQLFTPNEDDQEVGAKVLISSEPNFANHSLIFDMNIEVLGPKITEWTSKIRDAQLTNADIFKTLKSEIRAMFLDYVSFLRDEGGMTQLEAETAAMADILKYDVEALQFAIYTALNPANSRILRVVSKGSLVSTNTDNRFDASIKLDRVANPCVYIGTYEGIAIRSLYRKDPQGAVASLTPQPCIAINEELNENLVLVPFANVKDIHFGEVAPHEELPPAQRVSTETLEELENMATEGTDNF